MKIILDAYQYTSSITGTDRMARNFLQGLQDLDSVNQYYVICSEYDYVASAIKSDNFKIVRPIKVPGPALIKRILYKVWRVTVHAILGALQPDVYFSFHNMRLPRRRVAKKMLASNLDLIPLVLDDYKNIGRLKGEAAHKEFKRVVDLSDGFMSISNYSKNELCKVLGVKSDLVSVIYLAADPMFTYNDVANSDNKIKQKYILTVGGSEPRKNVKTVAEAFTKLPADVQDTYSLKVVGSSWHGLPLDELNIADGIELLGNVSDDDLVRLYRNAAVFVFASEYEGFGFTILEAMASGTATLNAKSSSLPEVAGDATLQFETHDSNAISRLILEVIEKPELRADLIKKSSLQSKKFTWQKSSQQLLDLITK